MRITVRLALSLMLLSPAAAQQPRAATTGPAETGSWNQLPAGIARAGDAGLFTVNFRNATIDTVLYELSRAFGFSVIKVSPMGDERIASIINLRGISQADALSLINISLNELGYAAIYKGNVLQIYRRSEAMTKTIPVRQFTSPEEVPMTD